MTDLVLERLGPEDLSTVPYHWKCDAPSVTEKAFKPGGGR
jgi:hypothetical protein